MTFTDWSDLRPPDSPNTWFVAPAGSSEPRADAVAPIYDIDAERVARAWRAVIEAQPRTEILAVSDDGLRIEAQQSSAVFGFIDRISSRVVALGPKRSTLAIYSRSTVGYWDLGVNRRRVSAWLEALSERIAAEPWVD